MKIKVCLVGERAVGKTSLIQRYVFNRFDDAYQGTLGSKLHLLAFSKQVSAGEIVEAQIALFDLMGEHAPRDAFRDAVFWGTHGYFAVADLSRPQTLYQLPAWVEAIRYVVGDVPFTVLLNKADLAKGVVGPQEAKWLNEAFPGVPYALSSAKTGEGVGRAFQALLERIVDSVLTKSLVRAQTNVLGERVLGFAHRRGPIGVTTAEILGAIRGTDPGALMTEVHALERLGYVRLEAIGPASFKVMITPDGEAVVARSGREDFVTEEAT